MAGIRQTSLRGFSGSRLEFIPPDRVRKYRGDTILDRWNADIAKHRALCETAKLSNLFKVPDIIEVDGYSGGYFDRRYVPGVTLERYLEDTRGSEVMVWSSWMVETLNVFSEKASPEDVDTVTDASAHAYLDGLWDSRVSSIDPHSASDRHWLDRYAGNVAFIRSS